MYARSFVFKSTSKHRGAIEEMADGIYGFTKTLKGFVSATYTVSEDATEYASFTVWQTKEDAEAAGVSIRERVMPKLEGIVTGPPEIKGMQVYEPRS